MKISYTGDAFESLIDIVNYIESINTLGSGLRWLNKFEDFLNNSLKAAPAHKLCNNRTFHDLGLRCLNFNDWVIAYSINADIMLIEAILHVSRLTN